MSDQWIVVPNWERFQHYRDRDPIWIKTYPALLNDDAYLDLSLATRGFLHGVWLLYARSRGVLSVSQARRVLVVSASDAKYARDHLEALNEAGLIEIVASKPLAIRYARGRDRERDREEKKYPPTPLPEEGGIQRNGKTSRAAGTNPRAVNAAAKVARHEGMVIAAWEQTRTDLVHERLDALEREHGAIFSDQEREQIIDATAFRAR